MFTSSISYAQSWDRAKEVFPGTIRRKGRSRFLVWRKPIRFGKGFSSTASCRHQFSIYLQTFLCIFFLSDFTSRLTPLDALIDLYDQVPLKGFLIPVLDVMVLARATEVVVTDGSTFGAFMKDVLWRRHWRIWGISRDVKRGVQSLQWCRGMHRYTTSDLGFEHMWQRRQRRVRHPKTRYIWLDKWKIEVLVERTKLPFKRQSLSKIGSTNKVHEFSPDCSCVIGASLFKLTVADMKMRTDVDST
ncbi:hypothetical protein BDR07DRAFT_1378976 [Suillus spraguei]|nr:hypothetical protein BDR07DRAFT_1378976 [Suillus spraguei]